MFKGALWKAVYLNTFGICTKHSWSKPTSNAKADVNQVYLGFENALRNNAAKMPISTKNSGNNTSEISCKFIPKLIVR